MHINVGIGKDFKGWFHKFEESLQTLETNGVDITFSVIDLDSNDFLKTIENFQAIIWHPNFMGLRLAGHFKEKIYFLEKYLGKTVFPNYDTIWHFESKIAENYLFTHGNINTPKTYVTFNYDNAIEIIRQIEMPIVLKKSEGAASKNVKLIQDRKWLLDYAQKVFCDQLWSEYRRDHSKSDTIFHNVMTKWFWNFLFSQCYKSDNGMGVLYLQEFIPKNDADLRITVIGDKYAYGFWRNNRPGDFRASGSGRLDFEREVPEEALRYCQNINLKYGFDTMAYDILFKDNQLLINEMSYGYIDRALYNAPGFYILGEDVTFVKEHTWPQSLWVKALYEKLKVQGKTNDS